MAAVVVVARSHEDRHAQLLDGRPVRTRRPTQDEVAQEARVAQTLAVVVRFVHVVDEVAGGDDDIQLPGRVQPVGERHEATELVVHVAHAGGRFGEPEVAQGGSEGVDPPGDVGVGDVREPEIGPRRAVIDRVRGDDLPADRPSAQRHVIELALGRSAQQGEADASVDRGRRPELERDDSGGVAGSHERDPVGEGRAHQFRTLRRESDDFDGHPVGAEDHHRV